MNSFGVSPFKTLGLIFTLMAALPVTALPLLPAERTDITVFDGDKRNDTGWYGEQEDDEVEPGMATNQGWDMEGFFLETGTSNLGFISGYNFNTGNSGYLAGDIFIDIDGNFIDGAAESNTSNGYRDVAASEFGYEYVIDVTWSNEGAGFYEIYDLTGNSAMVETPYYEQNYGSGGWRYKSGGILVEDIVGDDDFGQAIFGDGLTDEDTGYQGGNHYSAFGFDLSFLSDLGYDEFWVSTTMGCGNDHLLGYVGVAVPEPSSIVLLALGMLGLGVLRRQA